MKITFFNPHPHNGMIRQEAVDSWVGKQVPIKKDGVTLGVGIVLEVKVSAFGIETTLETYDNLGLILEE